MRTKKAANPRRDSILVFIREYYQDHRIAPNIREISSASNITSTSVTNYYLDKLEDEGMIERIAKISRGIKLTDRGMKYAMMLTGVDTNCTCYLCGAPIDQNGIYDPD